MYNLNVNIYIDFLSMFESILIIRIWNSCQTVCAKSRLHNGLALVDY